jgi:hypothetical protein
MWVNMEGMAYEKEVRVIDHVHEVRESDTTHVCKEERSQGRTCVSGKWYMECV